MSQRIVLAEQDNRMAFKQREEDVSRVCKSRSFF